MKNLLICLSLLFAAVPGLGQIIKQNPATTNNFGSGTGALNNDGTGNLSWIAVPLVTTNQTLFVQTNGNDNTAIRGRTDKPFLTVGAASLQTTNGDQILLGPGNFYEPTLATISNNVSLRGSGLAATTLTLSQGGPTNNPAGDSMILSGNASIYDMHIVMTQAWSWIDCGDTVLNGTNTIKNCWVQGTSDVFYMQQLNNTVQPGVIVDGCQLESGWDFVFFNSQSLNTNGGYIVVRNSTLTMSFSRFPYPWLYTTQSRGVNLGLGKYTGYLQYQNNLVSWIQPFGTNINFIQGSVSNAASVVSGISFNYNGTNNVVQNFPTLRAFLVGTNGNTGFVAHNSMLSNAVTYVDESFTSLLSTTVTAPGGVVSSTYSATNVPAQITFGTSTNKIFSKSGSNDIQIASSSTTADQIWSNQTTTINVPLTAVNTATFQSTVSLSGGTANSIYGTDGSKNLIAYSPQAPVAVGGGVVSFNGTGNTFTNTIIYGDSTRATNAWFFLSYATIGSNVVLVLTNTSGNGLWITNGQVTEVGGGIFTFGAAAQVGVDTVFDAKSNRFGTFGVWAAPGYASGLGFQLTNFQTGIHLDFDTNGVAYFMTISGNSTNKGTTYFGSTQQANIDASGNASVVSIVDSGNSQVAGVTGTVADYNTNNIYNPTNTFVNGPLDARFAYQLIITNNVVTISGFANLTNGVSQRGILMISNSSASSFTVVLPAGYKEFGDDTSPTLGTLQCTNAKMMKVEWDVVPGVWTNMEAKPQKN